MPLPLYTSTNTSPPAWRPWSRSPPPQWCCPSPPESSSSSSWPWLPSIFPFLTFARPASLSHHPHICNRSGYDQHSSHTYFVKLILSVKIKSYSWLYFDVYKWACGPISEHRHFLLTISFQTPWPPWPSYPPPPPPWLQRPTRTFLPYFGPPLQTQETLVKFSSILTMVPCVRGFKRVSIILEILYTKKSRKSVFGRHL